MRLSEQFQLMTLAARNATFAIQEATLAIADHEGAFTARQELLIAVGTYLCHLDELRAAAAELLRTVEAKPEQENPQ